MTEQEAVALLIAAREVERLYLAALIAPLTEEATQALNDLGTALDPLLFLTFVEASS